MISKHALSRYIERANVSDNEAMTDMISTIQPMSKKIKEALRFLDTVRIPLKYGLLAIVIQGKHNLVVKTVRVRKWK